MLNFVTLQKYEELFDISYIFMFNSVIKKVRGEGLC